MSYRKNMIILEVNRNKILQESADFFHQEKVVNKKFALVMDVSTDQQIFGKKSDTS